MTRETMNLIKERTQETAELVRYAAPISGRIKSRPTIERVTEILTRHIPYNHNESSPVITNIEVTYFHRNKLQKCARFHVTIANGKVWEISAYQALKGRTPEEREADKTAQFPSGLFQIFHDEITDKVNGGGEPAPTETPKPEVKTSYYERAFAKLQENGVPNWFIRLYALTDLIYWSRIYFYCNPYDIEANHGWYTTNGISITATPADKNRKCYGELKSLGFPTWDEYKVLFDGDEWDSPADFMNAYEEHREEWLQEAAEQKIRRTMY